MSEEKDPLDLVSSTSQRGHWVRCPDCFRALEVGDENTCRMEDCWVIDWMKLNYGAHETL